MSLNIRRVITGHDNQGNAKVLFDEVMKNPGSNRRRLLQYLDHRGLSGRQRRQR
jgi:hypothetical protein